MHGSQIQRGQHRGGRIRRTSVGRSSDQMRIGMMT
jgi:hypothetical protein